MASRVAIRSLWISSAASSSWLRSSSALPRLEHGSASSSRRHFSSQGTPSLRNADLSTSSDTSASTSTSTLETLAEKGSESSSAIMEPLVPFIEHLPELLHLPPSAHNYAISIVLLTVLLRSVITLPVTLWQRRRTQRMIELVVPKWDLLKKSLPESVAKRSRRQGKSYEAYEKELGKELKTQLRALTTKYKCNPTATFAVPLLVHFPLFISVSLLIRTSLLAAGSPLSSEIIPWWSPPAELTSKFETSAKMLLDRGLEGESLKKLTMMHGPTLSETDKTMLGPIGMGVLTTANVELGQWLRRGMTTEKEEERRHIEKHEVQAEKGKPLSKRIEVNIAPIKANVLGNILRAAAIGFVAVSSQAPAGLVVYWLTSASYTLVQNSTFALMDRQRAIKLKQLRDAD
ncbi:hypothetical protein CBS101457_001254 [Exobasidium rhododendri]|nr:hypothetical protein CBS101457_001254 [Exobasidium rhododendri]